MSYKIKKQVSLEKIPNALLVPILFGLKQVLDSISPEASDRFYLCTEANTVFSLMSALIFHAYWS